MPELSRFYGIIIRMYVDAGESRHRPHSTRIARSILGVDLPRPNDGVSLDSFGNRRDSCAAGDSEDPCCVLENGRTPSVPNAFIIACVNEVPLLQSILLLLCAMTWLVGGNLIVARHYRRRGIRRRRHLPYMSFPWRTFETTEWTMLAGVFVLTIGLLILALLAGP